MRVAGGTTNLDSAGNPQQINDVPDHVKAITVRAKRGNTGDVYLGGVGMTAAAGLFLEPGDVGSWDYDEGSERFSNLYFDGDTTGDDIYWLAVLE